MKVLDRKSLLEEMQLKKETVTLKTGNVIVTEVSAAEYLDAMNSPLAKDDKGEFDGAKFTALLATRCVVDGKGKRIFTDEDTELIRSGSARVLNRIGAAVKRVNGLTGDETKN